MALLTWAVLLLAGFSYTNALGNPTSTYNIPSIVQVEFRIVTTWLRQCAGTIITNYHVVSAASCFTNPAQPGDTSTFLNTRRIRAGADISGYSGILREVETISIYPIFNAQSGDGDLSVIRVDSSWWFGPNIGLSSIVPQGYFIPANVPVTLAGWGATAKGGIIGDKTLYSASLEVKDYSQCGQQYPGLITDNMLCVGPKDQAGRNFDASDIGAPVIYESHLAGVASFGKSSNNDQAPVVAQAIGAYTYWIVANAV